MTDPVKRLLAELCQGLPAEDLRSIVDSGCLRIEGMAICLQPGDETDPDGVAAYCDLGPLPDGEDGVRAAKRLLELNLCLFRPGATAFGIHARTGHAMAMVRHPIDRLDANSLRQVLIDLATVGAAWQATRFVDGSLSPPPPDLDPVTPT